MHTIEKITAASAVISKEANQERTAERTKCVYMSCEQNAGQNHNINVSYKSFENVVRFRHFGATLTNQKYISEQTKSKVNSRMPDTIWSRIFCV